jgi:hypothetical protein
MTRQNFGNQIRRSQSRWLADDPEEVAREALRMEWEAEEKLGSRRNKDQATREQNGPDLNSYNSCNSSPGAASVKLNERVWPQMADAAFGGLVGDIVRQIEPHTESDPVALLLNFLTMFGNIIGKMPTR